MALEQSCGLRENAKVHLHLVLLLCAATFHMVWLVVVFAQCLPIEAEVKSELREPLLLLYSQRLV